MGFVMASVQRILFALSFGCCVTACCEAEKAGRPISDVRRSETRDHNDERKYRVFDMGDLWAEFPKSGPGPRAFACDHGNRPAGFFPATEIADMAERCLSFANNGEKPPELIFRSTNFVVKGTPDQLRCAEVFVKTLREVVLLQRAAIPTPQHK